MFDATVQQGRGCYHACGAVQAPRRCYRQRSGRLVIEPCVETTSCTGTGAHWMLAQNCRTECDGYRAQRQGARLAISEHMKLGTFRTFFVPAGTGVGFLGARRLARCGEPAMLAAELFTRRHVTTTTSALTFLPIFFMINLHDNFLHISVVQFAKRDAPVDIVGADTRGKHQLGYLTFLSLESTSRAFRVRIP